MANTKLYEILGVEPNASTRDIVKAYRIAALKTHPDKLSKLSEDQREKAKASFIQLQHAYDILKDDERREKYDKYGWDGEKDDAFMAAYEYYKDPLTTEDIDDFAKTYKSSAAEKEDLIDFYNKHNGDITEILLYIPLSEAKDLDRFVKFYQDKIASDDLEATPKFKKSSTADAIKAIKQKYNKKMQKESKCSNERDNFDDLAAQIMANRKKREQDFSSVISNLEKKLLVGCPNPDILPVFPKPFDVNAPVLNPGFWPNTPPPKPDVADVCPKPLLPNPEVTVLWPKPPLPNGEVVLVCPNPLVPNADGNVCDCPKPPLPNPEVVVACPNPLAPNPDIVFCDCPNPPLPNPTVLLLVPKPVLPNPELGLLRCPNPLEVKDPILNPWVGLPKGPDANPDDPKGLLDGCGVLNNPGLVLATVPADVPCGWPKPVEVKAPVLFCD
ncbi:hypothetical protein protein, putative [Babesia ovis]|uniref:J domain-containing protein n=1 Tax=Babesia ovis TaxID=5869 RepID=A0A9W5WV76_BABOV|nr:hypothetical protein protein, putative [Babesia ovis]